MKDYLRRILPVHAILGMQVITNNGINSKNPKYFRYFKRAKKLPRGKALKRIINNEIIHINTLKLLGDTEVKIPGIYLRILTYIDMTNK